MNLSDLVLIGPAGAGKGTQADKLAERSGYRWISTGSIIRTHVARGDELGRTTQKFLDRGELVPDEIVEPIVLGELKQLPVDQPYVFDGFPRTIHQAKFLDSAGQASGRRLPKALWLNLSRGAAVARLANRHECADCGTIVSAAVHELTDLVCPQCQHRGRWIRRADDNPELIEARLNRFYATTLPLLDYYRRAGRLKEIDADGPVEQIAQLIGQVIGRP